MEKKQSVIIQSKVNAKTEVKRAYVLQMPTLYIYSPSILYTWINMTIICLCFNFHQIQEFTAFARSSHVKNKIFTSSF